MRRLILPLIITLLLGTACTREQVAKVLKKSPSAVTQQEITHWSQVWDQIQRQRLLDFYAAVAALHNQPFLVCTRAHESGGNYSIDTGNGYHGAYQFLQSTWNTTAQHAGWNHLVGRNPATVGVFWQDMVAWHLYQWQGKGPWNMRC